MADTALSIPRMSAKEYLERERDAAYKHEFVNGIVYAMAGASRRHNDISLDIFRALDDRLAPPCRAYAIDVKVHIENIDEEQFYYPDVVVTCSELDIDSHLIKQPSLIVEVVSPTTEDADRGFKFDDYRRLHSVQEYVLVLQEKPSVELYRRRTNWQKESYGLADEITFESIRVTVPVVLFYRRVTF